MGGKTDIVKGRIEEAAGALIGNDKLREKGQTDQAVGQAKQAAEKGVDQAKHAARKVVNEAKDVAPKAVDKPTGVT